MRAIKMDTPSPGILRSIVGPKNTGNDSTLHGDHEGLDSKHSHYRKSIRLPQSGQCRREDKTDTTVKDHFDPTACATTLMIRGTDLQIPEGDLSILSNRRVFGHKGIGGVEQIAPGISELHLC
jgi:hypothetical protein